MNGRKPLSLASRLSWLYGVSILVATMTSLVWQTRQEFIRHISESQQSVKKMADLSLRQLSDSAVIGDYDTIKRTLATLVPDSPLSDAAFQDSRGGLLHSSQRTDPDAPQWLVSMVRAQLPDLMQDIEQGGRKYGELTLQFDAEKIASEFWNLILKIIAFTVVAMVLGLRLMHHLVRRWLGNLDLATYEQAVLSGEVNAQVRLTGDAPLEIRNTIDVINRTAGSLRAQFGLRIDSLMDSLIQHKRAVDEATIVCELDTEGRLTYANDSFVDAIGLRRELLMNRRLVDIGSINLTSDDYWRPRPETWHGEVMVESTSGRQRWLRRSIVPNSNSAGQIDRYICIDIDITEQKRSERDLRDQVHRQQLINEFSGLALVAQDDLKVETETVRMACMGLMATHVALIVQTPADRRQTVAAVVGWSKGWLGRDLAGLLPSPGSQLAPVFETLDKGHVLEVTAVTSQGGRLSLVVAHAREDGFSLGDEDFLRGLLFVLDATLERARARDQLLYLAQFDGLTGLPNRVLLLDRLDVALEAARSQAQSLTLLYVDFDGFKLVNDTLGHETGDLLLVQAAQRMASCLRAGDTVARLSGDEFVILLTDLQQAGEASLIGRKVLKELSQPFLLQGQEAFISASIGASVFPDDGGDAATLLRHADQAMYYAKDMGRNAFYYYEQEMGLRLGVRQALEKQLRGALERGEFFLLYQPKVSAKTQQISGFEALLRWRHPERGVVGPDEFVTVLEETGMIVSVGQWVLECVAEQVLSWQAQGLHVPRVAVNLSARQFSSEQFEATVLNLLRHSQIDPRLLEFELTESMLMQDPDAALATIEKFHRFGLSFSIDDFGTGYSSLSLLNRFPLDAIKIDRSFVRDMAENPRDAAITRSIITLAHSLQLKVVAEGVETAEQLAMLAAWDCDEIQGYYFSKPVHAHDCAAMLAGDQTLAGWSLSPSEGR